MNEEQYATTLGPLRLTEEVTGDQPQVSFVPASESQLKRESKFGVCLWWSDEKPFWLHPEDVEIAKSFVPGNRVLRRSECQNFADRELGYSVFQYGESEFRALPAIWLEISGDGYELNDLVQVKSQYGRLDPVIATICEIKWNQNRRKIEYHLSVNGRQVSRVFEANEIQPAIRLNSHLNHRELRLSSSRLI